MPVAARTRTSANDLSVPASTNTEALLEAIDARASDTNMSVVFFDVPMIDVISKAQADGLEEVRLVICMRRSASPVRSPTSTTSRCSPRSTSTNTGRRQAAVHDRNPTGVRGRQAKAKAADADVLVASMDDESTFGPVFHELRFGDAVAQRLLDHLQGARPGGQRGRGVVCVPTTTRQHQR